MQSSNWIAAAKDGAHEYIPVSSTPLDSSYQRSISAARTGFHAKMGMDMSTPASKVAPASSWMAQRSTHQAGNSKQIGTFGASIVLGSDTIAHDPTNRTYGKDQELPVEAIDLLTTVPIRRDTTLDGAHRASMNEVRHLQKLTLWPARSLMSTPYIHPCHCLKSNPTASLPNSTIPTQPSLTQPNPA